LILYLQIGGELKMNLFKEGLSKYLNEAQIKSIQSKKIGIAGCGGLGSNLAVMLVRCGFKYFEILDSDSIEPSNLNRQYYFLNEVGQPKIDILKDRLLQINDEIEIITHKVHWQESTGNQFFKDCDFIAEAFDNAKDKHAFVQYYQNQAPYVISGNGMAGILIDKKMQIKKLDNVFIVGDQSTDTNDGHPPLSPRVTRCASLMAEIILDLSLKN